MTLVTDARRKVVKDMLKSDAALLGVNSVDEMKGRVLSRTVSASTVSEYAEKLANLGSELQRILQEEKVEQQMREVEREATRAENVLIHEAEIASRPPRTWHQTESQKQARKDLTRQIAKEESLSLLPVANTGTAQERQIAIEVADDYRDDKHHTIHNGIHRLSRKKLRRLQALKELKDQNNGNDIDGINMDTLYIIYHLFY